MGDTEKIILDTHVLLWWLSNPERLSKKALKAIESAKVKGAVYVSSISVWEICMLVMKKRLELRIGVKEWVSKCEALPFINFVPVNNLIAMESVFLSDNLNRDPADRIIVATAKVIGGILVTMDKNLHKYSGVRTIW